MKSIKIIFLVLSCCFSLFAQEQLPEPYNNLALEVQIKLDLFESKNEVTFLSQANKLLWGSMPSKATTIENQNDLYLARTSLLLKILNVVLSNINPGFEIENAPLMNIYPPVDVTDSVYVWASGMSPETIRDSLLKQNYTMALEQNHEKHRLYRFQKNLLSLKESMIGSLASTKLLILKSKPGNMPTRLDQLIYEYIDDKNVLLFEKELTRQENIRTDMIKRTKNK